MDKYEFNIKVEQIKKMTEEGDYVTAMKIADSIDWSRVRNANLLSMVAGVYEQNGEYQEAKDVLLLAFERAPVGKRLLFKLTEVSVKSGDLEEAEDFCREFTELAPDDTRVSLLKYMILKAKGASAGQLIHTLEQYISQELDEKWLYELAELYARAGMADECVKTCDRITLLFGLGTYSEKAMQLKQNFAPLSDYQRDLLENRGKYEQNLREVQADSARAEALQERGCEAEDGAAEETEPQAEQAEWDADAYSEALANERYENEDAEFEAYLRMHEPEFSDMSEETIEADKAQPSADSTGLESAAEGGGKIGDAAGEITEETPSSGTAEDNPAQFGENQETPATVSYDDGYLNEGFAKEPSGEDGHLPEQDMEEAPVNPDAAAAKAAAAAQAAAISGAALSKGTAAGLTAAGAAIKSASDAETGAESGTEAAAPKSSERPRPQARVEFTHKEPEKREPEAISAERPAVPAAEGSSVSRDKAAAAVCQAVSDNAAKVQENGPFHMIIEAESAEEGLSIAVDELKYIHNQYGITNAAAKTTAEKLNQRGLSQTALKKLYGKDFIVEHAGSLDPDIMEEILSVIERDQTGMIVVLVDTPEGLDRLEDNCPKLFDVCDLVSDSVAPDEEGYNDAGSAGTDENAEKTQAGETADSAEQDDVYDEEPYDDDAYEDAADEDDAEELGEEAQKPLSRAAGGSAKGVRESVIRKTEVQDDEQMEIDDFAQYCCQYAASIDCSITGKSMLALYERIELMEEDNIPLTKKNAEDLIEETADHAEKPPIGKRIKGLFHSKYDKNGLLILKEEDFIH